MYDQILNHPNTSDELRRTTESKLLQYKANYLHSLPLTEEFRPLKQKLREEVDELIQGMILLQIPSELAWTLYFEERDCETMGELINSFYCPSADRATNKASYDFSLMKQMIQLLPSSSLAMVFTGYFKYISEPLSNGGENKEGEKRPPQNEEEEDPFDTIMVITSYFSPEVS